MIVDLIAANSGDSAPLWLLAAGPVGGVGTYWLIWRYYRNSDKSHSFEKETLIEAQPIKGGESVVGQISKTRESRIKGDNGDDYRERVARVPSA